MNDIIEGMKRIPIEQLVVNSLKIKTMVHKEFESAPCLARLSMSFITFACQSGAIWTVGH